MKADKIVRIGTWLAVSFWLMACQTSPLSEGEGEADEASLLEFQVVSQVGRPLGASPAWNAREVDIKELYIYAFDDVHKRPDFYWDVIVNNAVDFETVKHYSVQMDINGVGPKRFYLIANPPQYIKKELTFDCSEGKLKTLTLELQHPLDDILKLPQSSDGVSSPGGVGFPMGHQFTAFVKKQKSKRRLQLTATEESTVSLTRIPVFRSLGKVTVTARKREEGQESVAVESLRLFNYTCNGFFLPLWQHDPPLWNNQGGWNPQALFDLKALVPMETKVGVEPVALLKQGVKITSNRAQELASFYLCQNSYGDPLQGETQPGVDDPSGNRITKLAVDLSDGRHSVIALPYLRRNDHLFVHLLIDKNKVEITFLPWGTNEVTPEWKEELTANPNV